MSKIRITVEVDQSDIRDDGKGNLTITKDTVIKKVKLVDNPVFKLLSKYDTFDMSGASIVVNESDQVKLMACGLNDSGQSIFRTKDNRDLWIPNDIVQLVSGNLGIDARD